MFGLGAWEIVVILFVGLLVMGPERLPELARTVGRTVRAFRGAASGFREAFDEGLGARGEASAGPVALSGAELARRKAAKHVGAAEAKVKPVDPAVLGAKGLGPAPRPEPSPGRGPNTACAPADGEASESPPSHHPNVTEEIRGDTSQAQG